MIARAGAGDLDELVALMRAYCDFYGADTAPQALRALARTLIERPQTAGVQLIARAAEGGRAIGFATLYWSHSTLHACAIGVMNDLYVEAAARGGGVGAALIRACERECAVRGIGVMEWATAPANATAQSLYDRFGAERSEWVTYTLRVGGAA